jgi:hypothetical protein
MKVKLTLTAKKVWTEEYPDNNFSDEVIIDNFWSQTFDQDEFLENAKLDIKRKEE